MATQASGTLTENLNNNTKSVWTIYITGVDVTASGSTFTLPELPAANVKFKYVGSNKGYAGAYCYVWTYPQGASRESWNSYERSTKGFFNDSKYPASTSGTTYQSKIAQGGPYGTYNTSSYFTSSNKTSKTVNIVGAFDGYFCSHNSSYDGMNSATGNFNQIYSSTPTSVGTIATITLKAPPTCTATVSSSGPYYANGTSYTVTVSSLSAKYGGDISEVKLTVGSQTATRTTNGNLTIALNKAGTFSPTMTVKDSRGQTQNYTFSQITVNTPTTSIDEYTVARIDSNGLLKDDGEYLRIAIKVSYTKFSGNYLLQPSVKVNNTAVSNVTWYTSWSSSGGFSNPVTWTNYQPNSPIVLYGKCTSMTFDTSQSYAIRCTPNTTYATGKQLTRSLMQSFYLLVGKAGGRSLGIGMKPIMDVPRNTGVLDIGNEIWVHNKNMWLRNTSATMGTAPGTNFGCSYHVADYNNNHFAFFQGIQYGTGQTAARLGVYNMNGSTKYGHALRLGVNLDGSAVVSVTDNASGTLATGVQAAWRNAIGAFPSSGGWATGDIDITKATDAHFKLKSTGQSTRIDAAAPSANRKLGGFQILDNHDTDNVVFYSETMFTTEQQQYSSFVTRRYSADASSSYSHGFYLRINKDGTMLTNFTNATARDAWMTGLNALSKAGGVMGGILRLQSSNLPDTKPSSTTQGNVYLNFQTSSGKQSGYIVSKMTSDGYSTLDIAAVFPNTSQTAQLRLGVNSSGTQWVGVSGAAAWRSAINAVNKSGDTVGKLTFNSGMACTGGLTSCGTSMPYFLGLAESYGDGGDVGYVTSSNVCTAIGAQRAGSSSMRYKHDIKLLEDTELDAHKLYKLKVKQFIFNDDFERLQYDDMRGKVLPGFIAEDVAKIYPAAAITKDGKIESWDERRLLPAMLMLIQEQHEEIERLKRAIA